MNAPGVVPDGCVLRYEHLDTLAGLADELIPRGQEMPSATDVDIVAQVVDRVLRVRDDLVAGLRRVLDDAHGEEPAAAIERMKRSDQDGLLLLKLVVGGGYLMHPRVGNLLGYHGQEAKVVNKDDYLDYVSAGLLNPVVERGAIYRNPPPRR